MTNLELENEFQDLAVLAQDSLGKPIPHYLEPEFPAFLDSLEGDNPYLYQQLKAFHPDALLARGNPPLEGEVDPLEDGPSRKGNVWRNLQRKLKDAAWWRPASFEAKTKVLNKGRGNMVLLTIALGFLGIYTWNYYAKSMSSLHSPKTASSSGSGSANSTNSASGANPSSSAEQLKNATSIPQAPSTTATALKSNTTPETPVAAGSPFPHTDQSSSQTPSPPPAFGVQPEMAQSSPRVVEAPTPSRSSVFPLKRMDSPVTLNGVPRIQVHPSSGLSGVFPSSARAVQPTLGAAPAIVYQRSGQIGQARGNTQNQFLANSSNTSPKVTVLGKMQRTPGLAYQKAVGKETGKEVGKDSSLMYVSSSKTNGVPDAAPMIEPPALNPVVYQGQNTAREEEVKVLYRRSSPALTPVPVVQIPETPKPVPSTPSITYQSKNTARGDEVKMLYSRSSSVAIPVVPVTEVQIPETPKIVSSLPITYQSKNTARGDDAKVLYRRSSPALVPVLQIPETPKPVSITPSIAYQSKNAPRGDDVKVLYRRSSPAPVPVVQIPETPKPVSITPSIAYQSKNAPRGDDAKVLYRRSSSAGDAGKNSPVTPTQPPEVFGGGAVANDVPVVPAPTVVETPPSSNVNSSGIVYAGKNKAPANQVLYSNSKKPITSNTATTIPSSIPNPTPSIPGLEAGVSAIPSRLITALEVAYGDSKPVVAESDLGVWVGTAIPNPQYGRMELHFDRLIQNGKVYPVTATGFDTAYQQGLEGRVQDSNRNILQDVARQSANALNIYAQQLAQSSSTAILGNGTALQSKQAAPLQAILAGEVGKLLQLPEQQGGFYRTMRLERTTALYIMVGVGSGGVAKP